MASITVHDGEPIEKAIKRFQKVVAPIKAQARKHEYHLSKKDKIKMKQKQNRKHK